MKKKIYITSYKPAHLFPCAYESYESVMKYYDKEKQFLLEVEVECPDPDETIIAKEI